MMTEQGVTVYRDLIWTAPERVGGAPCFLGTRVPISILFDYLEANENLDRFLEGYPSVTREQAVAVLKLGQEELLRLAMEHDAA